MNAAIKVEFLRCRKRRQDLDGEGGTPKVIVTISFQEFLIYHVGSMLKTNLCVTTLLVFPIADCSQGV